MSKKYMELQNPYEYPIIDWYSYNDLVYLLDILSNVSGWSEVICDEIYDEFKSSKSEEEKLKINHSLLSYLGVEYPSDFASPVSTFAGILEDVPLEDIPKAMYLLDHPEAKDIPANFNPITFPDYFVVDQEAETSDVTANDIYNEILKKTLDSRNNTLDARKFNTGINPDQIATLANAKINNTNGGLKVEDILDQK